MGFFIYAIIVLAIAYLISERIDDKRLLKKAQSYVYSKNNMDKTNKSIKKYLLSKNNNIFINTNNELDIILIEDLQYSYIIDFKKIIALSNENKIYKHKIFIHKNSKHLILPFYDDNQVVEVLLLSKKRLILDDLFKK
ncbi:MAG: hypothetical protein JW735_06810 [Prolixibacteraceae bacterium]|nr:hypothetical protein [Prolixibacteraceae bacterium]